MYSICSQISAHLQGESPAEIFKPALSASPIHLPFRSCGRCGWLNPPHSILQPSTSSAIPKDDHYWATSWKWSDQFETSVLVRMDVFAKNIGMDTWFSIGSFSLCWELLRVLIELMISKNHQKSRLSFLLLVSGLGWCRPMYRCIQHLCDGNKGLQQLWLESK